jgi:hypothetical protein
MIFNTASDILDPVKLNYCPLFNNLPQIQIKILKLISLSWTLPKPGTPEVTGAISDDSPSRTTVCVRFDKKAEIQFNV